MYKATLSIYTPILQSSELHTSLTRKRPQSRRVGTHHFGQDKESGEIWWDSIQFLRSGDVLITFLSPSPITHTGNPNMGRTTQNGRPLQSLPLPRPDHTRQCGNPLTRSRSVRKQPQPDHR